MVKPQVNEEANLEVGSVSDRILASFVEAVAQEEGLLAVAKRLKTTIVEQHLLTEPALRAALFGEKI